MRIIQIFETLLFQILKTFIILFIYVTPLMVLQGTSIDSNSDKEIVLDITGLYDEEILDKQSITGCDCSESLLNEEGNDVITLNG